MDDGFRGGSPNAATTDLDGVPGAGFWIDQLARSV